MCIQAFLVDAVIVFAEPEVCTLLPAWEQCVEGLSLIDALQDPEDAVPVGQRRAWCWCMCFGLAFMLAGVFLGGAYLYKYFAFQVSHILIMRGLFFAVGRGATDCSFCVNI